MTPNEPQFRWSLAGGGIEGGSRGTREKGAYMSISGWSDVPTWRFMGNSAYVLITGLKTLLITPLNGFIGITPIISAVRAIVINSY